MTIQLIIDSSSDLDPAYVAANQILALGVTITIDNETYPTVGENRLQTTSLLSKMAMGAKPLTSQVNVGQFLDAFESVVAKGQEVFYLALSSGLSGTYNSALTAKNMLLETYPDAKITLFDSLAASVGEGFLVKLAVDQLKKAQSSEALAAYLSEVAPRLISLVMVDDLYHLQRGGRISKATALVGSLAKIKPLLAITADGKLTQTGKVRGKKKAYKQLQEQVQAEISADFPRIMIGYTGDPSEANYFGKQLEDLGYQIEISELGPAIATHTGTGTLAVFYIGQNPRK